MTIRASLGNHESYLDVVAARLISQQQVLKKRLLSYTTKVMRLVGGFIPLLTPAFRRAEMFPFFQGLE